jgi:hypothetical protein
MVSAIPSKAALHEASEMSAKGRKLNVTALP